jgi:hypothetical protein
VAISAGPCGTADAFSGFQYEGNHKSTKAVLDDNEMLTWEKKAMPCLGVPVGETLLVY